MESLPKQQLPEDEEPDGGPDSEREKPPSAPRETGNEGPLELTQNQRQRELSRRQAEAVLQKVRDRERQHREMQKRLQGARRTVTVVKDW